MATNNMVPYSNPAGNNQTTPGAGTQAKLPAIATPNPIAGTGTAQATTSNPLIPATASTGAMPTSVVPSVNGGGALGNQLGDIYVAGVGGSLNSFLDSMSGTNSVVLQNYIQSLQPQEAKAQSNLDMSLGAGGVGSNSSVAAIGNANLQAQETGMIAGESNSLIQNQEQMTEQMLMGIAPTAAKQVSDSSPLNMIGQVLGDVGSVAGDVMGLDEVTGGMGVASKMGSFGGASPVPSSLGSTGANDLPGLSTYA